MSKTMKLKMSQVRIDGGTQVRLHLDADTVDRYAELMGEGEVFRAVDVYHDGSDYWLSDGFHRYHAARKAGQDTIAAMVRPGTQQDAVWVALTANRLHGLPLTR